MRSKGSTISAMADETESVSLRPPEGSIVDTRYWHLLDDGRVQCDVCPRACKLHDGQRGLCFVRGAEAGRIKLFSYGRSSGFCIDPIEKQPLNHFLPRTSGPLRRRSSRPITTWSFRGSRRATAFESTRREPWTRARRCS